MLMADRRPRRRHAPPRATPRRGRIALVAALLVVAVAVGGAFAYLWNLDRTVNANLDRVSDAFPAEESRPAPPVVPAGAQAEPITVLLIGGDARPGSSMSTPQRSDLLMVMRISAERDRVSIVSIPRDSWVDVPGRGKHKINAAYAYGGFPLAVATVEQLLGSRIDHVAAIDMQGLKDMTDALGGVQVQVASEFDSGGYHFEPGPRTLDGDEALAFVRERKSFASGDLERVVNQQRFLTGLITEALGREGLKDPGQLSALATTTSTYLTVDDELTGERIREIGWDMLGVTASDLDFETIGVTGTGRSSDGQSIVVLDPAGVDRLSTALADDTMESYEP